MVTPKWRSDGIPGHDKVIRVNGDLYKLATVKDAASFAGMKDARRRARVYAGRSGKVFRIKNTYSFAAYLPYSGSERPLRR